MTRCNGSSSREWNWRLIQFRKFCPLKALRISFEKKQETNFSHVSLEGTSANRWLNEMDGQRRIIAKFANANEEEIVGMRAPQLALGGDEQFEVNRGD